MVDPTAGEEELDPEAGPDEVVDALDDTVPHEEDVAVDDPTAGEEELDP